MPQAARDSNRAGAIISVTVIDLADQAAALQIALFNKPFTPTADNVAMAVSDADARNCVGWIAILAADYNDFGGFRLATVKNQWLGYQCPDGNLYGQVMTSGTPTYALDTLFLRIVALWD